MSTTSRSRNGALIRVARVAAGMRQTELARDLGVSASTLCRLERDRRQATAIELATIVRVLQVETAYRANGNGRAA
jgi:XRE family transcriptional regulator, fatty acid utilization regulator